MWFDGQRQPNTIYVANTSRGKDSTAMLRAIQLMGWPLDMICSVDIWATQDIPAELPPMVKFKDEYDQKVLDWFGVPVTRLCATKRSQNVNAERERERPERLSYESLFYTECVTEKWQGHINGFPTVRGGWCKRLKDTASRRETFAPDLSRSLLQTAKKHENKRRNLWVSDTNRKLVYGCSKARRNDEAFFRSLPLLGGQTNVVHYIGIAADEPLRIKKHLPKPDMVLPLVQIGWDEALCGLEAQYMDMLSPTYSDGQLRDGCWFCHNQSVDSLRRLRRNYPDLWALLMKWDTDSPVTWHPDGHTVHDFDKRFQMEDEMLIDPAKPFFWKMLDEERNYMMKL